MSIIKGTNKIVAGFGGTKENIGDVKWSYSKLATDNSGRLPLFTGETIASANTIYPDFYNWVLAHTELQCTSAEYEASLTTYGECAKYVIGDGSLRLPLIRNYIKAANPSEGIKNIEAGLPNITGATSLITGANDMFDYGAFYKDSVNKKAGIYGNASGTDSVNAFDASRSSAVYGKSSTVTPASTTLYPWVVAYVAAIPASTAQAAAFQQGLSGKADTNLGNIPSNYDYVVESYKDDQGNWYRKYKSGWLEQGGTVLNIPANSSVNITFLKPFANTLYTALCTPNNITSERGDKRENWGLYKQDSTYCQMANNSETKTVTFSWYTCGQGA